MSDEAKHAATALLVAAGLAQPPAPVRWAVSSGADVRFELGVGDELVIGRTTQGQDDTVVVASEYVSRRHALIHVDRAGAWLTDLGSSNGTWLERDGTMTPVGVEPVELAVGDVIVTIEGVTLASVTLSGAS